MGNLKTGGLRDVLEHVSVDDDAAVPEGTEAADALAAWMEWEVGQTPPEPVLTRLHAAGVRPLLESLSAAAAGAADG